MTTQNELDLIFTRDVAVAPELLYRGWTDANWLAKWFCPRPWQVTSCELDPKPGGAFNTVFEGPDGQKVDNVGCYLELIPNRKVVFTDALSAGFRPTGSSFMAGVITFEPIDGGTRYTALVRHKNAEDLETHRSMGFEDGWGKALDQLVELCQAEG